jgi:hypothetical protein
MIENKMSKPIKQIGEKTDLKWWRNDDPGGYGNHHLVNKTQHESYTRVGPGRVGLGLNTTSSPGHNLADK